LSSDASTTNPRGAGEREPDQGREHPAPLGEPDREHDRHDGAQRREADEVLRQPGEEELDALAGERPAHRGGLRLAGDRDGHAERRHHRGQHGHHEREQHEQHERLG
jgi:hypothetical protein